MLIVVVDGAAVFFCRGLIFAVFNLSNKNIALRAEPLFIREKCHLMGNIGAQCDF